LVQFLYAAFAVSSVNMVERSAALDVLPFRAGNQGYSHDHSGRCSSKNASSRECLGFRCARNVLLFDVVADWGWRYWADLSCQHHATARLHLVALASGV